MPQIASHVPRIVIGSKEWACGWIGACVHIINGLWEHGGGGTGIASMKLSSWTTNERGNIMTVEQLIAKLQTMPQHATVALVMDDKETIKQAEKVVEYSYNCEEEYFFITIE